MIKTFFHFYQFMNYGTPRQTLMGRDQSKITSIVPSGDYRRKLRDFILPRGHYYSAGWWLWHICERYV